MQDIVAAAGVQNEPLLFAAQPGAAFSGD